MIFYIFINIQMMKYILYIVSLSNWSKYIPTALDFISAIANFLGISLIVTH